MDSRTVWFMAVYLLGVTTNSRVTLIPRFLLSRKGEKVTLRCAPMSGHLGAYWYRQDPGQGPYMLFSFYNKKEQVRGNITQRFSAEQPDSSDFRLTVSMLAQEDSAVYLCASSKDRVQYGELFFGAGTRLTVLDDLQKVKLPKVTLFDPSEEEINELGKATLVCLATGFFPDLVEISWWVDGQETKEGVSTDAQPLNYTETKSSNSTYALSSRLRVSAGFWQNPWRRFRCQVHFYGLSDSDTWTDSSRPKPVTQNISVETWGKADCGITAASYQKSVQSATFLYEILLGKALVYAVLVSTLVWRAKAKKHVS